ncbi:hypothetical protein F4781DRAFT_441757 [Annulohypoxylon bovei var. microspora]|nr:hypothetical protein F4781DRAFT_441757 [Annulohypoxylon bovei var. microspora]
MDSSPNKGYRNPVSFTGSGLDISFVTSIALVERADRDSQFIKFGTCILVFPITAQPPLMKINVDVGNYIQDSPMILSAHIYSPGDCGYYEGDIVYVAGTLGAWGFRTSAGDMSPNDLCWQTLLTTSLQSIHGLPNVQLIDPHDMPVQKDWVGCSFYGRVCSPPETRYISLHVNQLRPLLEHGVFIELSFFLNRKDDHKPPDLVKRGSYSFYIFLLFDESARKRHAWVFTDDKMKLRDDQYIFCSGHIIGQLKDKFISRAGYEAKTPSNQCPIHAILPSVTLRAPTSFNNNPTPTSTQGSSPSGASIRSNLQQRLMQSAKRTIQGSTQTTLTATKNRSPKTPTRQVEVIEDDDSPTNGRRTNARNEDNSGGSNETRHDERQFQIVGSSSSSQQDITETPGSSNAAEEQGVNDQQRPNPPSELTLDDVCPPISESESDSVNLVTALLKKRKSTKEHDDADGTDLRSGKQRRRGLNMN